MQDNHTSVGVDDSTASPHTTGRRSLLSWWPAATGLALGAVSVATDDPDTVDGALLVLLLATCAYAFIAFTGRPSWSWRLTALVVVVHLSGEVLSGAGAVTVVVLTLGLLGLGVLRGRWRPPPAEMAWQSWGAATFISAVLLALWLDTTAAKAVVAVALLLHGAWDIVHWRRQAVVSRSLAEWCACLDITLGLGVLGLLALA